MASTTSLTGLGISGLSSGLDTTGIITKLMSIEAAPQTTLKTRLSTTTSYRTALQSLNAAVAGIASTAANAAKADALTSFAATSDKTSATVTASSFASAGSVSFTVDRLAAAQTSVSRASTAWDTANIPSLTFRRGGDPTTDTTVTFASSKLDDVVTAINASNSGVTASKVAAGRDASGAMQYRLQLRSATGADNAFTVSKGTSWSQDDGAALGLSTVSVAQDAKITLYADSADAKQEVTSATNTFDELLTGVDVTVSAVSTDPVTVDVETDATAATTAAQGLTAQLITLFSGVASSTAVTTTTGSTGSTATSGGIFTGDSAVRALKDALLSAVSGPVRGKSPSTIGIVLTKDGTITFDQAKFAAAMSSDPVGTASMFQTIATSVEKVASDLSDPSAGSLTLKIQSQQATETSMTKEISDWDTRLAVIQAQYTAQFNALETALNSLSSQSSYLTSQIAGLTTNYQKS